MKVGKKVRNRVFPLLLAIIMVFSMMPTAVFGAEGDATTNSTAQFSDMPDNWSTKALQNAAANGLLGGSDGKIMPNQNLTRAQMAAVITRAFGSTVKGDVSGFADVKPTDWFADGMAKAYQMGAIKGSGNQMNPNSAITRQEVFVILARAFKLQPANTMNKAFGDTDKIAGWAKGEVAAFVNAGYIQGAGGKLNPTSLITRAEFAQIFDNILKQYINKAGEYTQVADGNVMVNVPGVTLKNLKVNGDLVIGDGVGNGEVTLDSVAVAGRMVVRGGGENSIIIKGSSSVSNVVVARVDGAVSVKVQGDAKVEVLYIDDGSDDVSVQGTFGKVEVAAPEIVVKAVGATINNIAVVGEGAKVVVDDKSKVEKVEVAKAAASAKVEVAGKVVSVTIQAQNTQISGTGTVTKVEAQTGSTGSKIETPNTQISVGAGVSGVTAGGGTKVEAGTTTNNNANATGTTGPTAQLPSTGGGGGGGGGGGTPTISVSTVTVTDGTKFSVIGAYPDLSFRYGGSVLTATTVSGIGPYTYVFDLPVSNRLKVGANSITVSKSGYLDGTATANYTGIVVASADGVQGAINSAKAGDTVYLPVNTYITAVPIIVTKAGVTVSGANGAVIQAKDVAWNLKDDVNKHLFKIEGGTQAMPITIENITFDGFNRSAGVNTYSNAYGIFKNVTIKNSANAALIVNGSTIEAQNLNTNGNAWGSVNVDPGDGVKTPSVFTIDNASVLTEFKQIWSDGAHVKQAADTAIVTVNAPSDYKQYKFQAKSDEVDTMWIKGLKNVAVLDGWIYLDIREAINTAVEISKTTSGAVVTIMEGTYEIKGKALEINGKIIVEGASQTGTILKGFYPILTSATVNLNGGATLRNLTVTRDNTDWVEATNNNKSLVTLSKLTADTTLENCIITNGRNGVYMLYSHEKGKKAIVKNNIITENRTGINFCGDCSDAEITENDITNNSTIGIVTYSNENSDLSTITLTGNIITGNWLAQILIKYDNAATVPDNIQDAPAASQVKGTLVITDNTFEGTVTVAPCYNAVKAEPLNDNQRPKWGGGSDEKPSWTPPTVRIYNQPKADIDYDGKKAADLPVYDETQQ